MTGAVIVAAGKSSRMGTCKALLPMGQTSAVKRIIAALCAGGVERIVVVTGHHHQELTQHLANTNVTLIYNEHYATSHMLDSAKLGLAYLEKQCHTILFTPVDIPLFTAYTVKRLLMTSQPMVIPTWHGVEGHPLKLQCEIISALLEFEGEGGLRGALDATGMQVVYLPVDDQGVAVDMDTPADYAQLLKQA